MIGSRPFVNRDDSANNWPVAFFTFGEGLQNNHHALPGCLPARNALVGTRSERLPDRRPVQGGRRLGPAHAVRQDDQQPAEAKQACQLEFPTNPNDRRGLIMFGKQQTPPIEGPLTYDSLRDWMVADLARRLRCAPSEIDTAKPFDALGLDSRNAVQISGALQKVVGKRLSPAVLFDHETIDAPRRVPGQRAATSGQSGRRPCPLSTPFRQSCASAPVCNPTSPLSRLSTIRTIPPASAKR